jgi:fructokinase
VTVGAPRRAIAVGEALIDEYPGERVVAGAPLHVLAHLTALGWDTALVTRVGDDPDGARIVAAMASAGVGTGFVEVDPDLPTGRTTITPLPGHGHTFTVHRPAAWDAVAGPDPVPTCDVLVFGSLALRDQRSRSAVGRLVAGAATVAVDLNLRPPDVDAAALRWALEHADLVKATAEEERLCRDLLGVSALTDLGARWSAITSGADGAALVGRAGAWRVPAPAVAIVDAVGAGDAFLAGLIDGLVPDGDPEDALGRGVALAADTLGRRGGMPAPGPEGSR